MIYVNFCFNSSVFNPIYSLMFYPLRREAFKKRIREVQVGKTSTILEKHCINDDIPNTDSSIDLFLILLEFTEK